MKFNRESLSTGATTETRSSPDCPSLEGLIVVHEPTRDVDRLLITHDPIWSKAQIVQVHKVGAHNINHQFAVWPTCTCISIRQQY